MGTEGECVTSSFYRYICIPHIDISQEADGDCLCRVPTQSGVDSLNLIVREENACKWQGVHLNPMYFVGL